MTSPLQKIISPLDFDDNSLSALEIAAEFARLADATLFLLHVLPAPSPGLGPGRVDAFVAEERATRAKLEEIARDRLSGLRYEVLTRTGDPAVGILRATEEVGAQLLVIAAHRSRARPKPFRASVAEKVIRQSICPVVSVRPSPSGDPDAVATHMTPTPVTVSPDTTLSRLQQLMADKRIRSIPVLENDNVVGIVTDRDIAASDAAPDTAVGILMTREIVSVSPRTSIQEAARLLLECEVEGLPVVDNQKLVGVISRSDILQAFAGVEPSPRSGR